MIGRPDGDVVAGTLASARHWDLPHRILTAAEVHAILKREPWLALLESRPTGDYLLDVLEHR